MPAGRVHEQINGAVLTAALATAGLLTWHGGLPASLWHWQGLIPAAVGGFLLGTFWITPDLDLAEGNVNAKRNWGPLGFLWVPYGAVSRHRGRSHSYLLGPLSRLAYLAVIAGILLAVLGVFGVEWSPLRSGPSETQAPENSGLWRWAGALTAGYLVSQWLHLIADGVWPWTRH